MSSARIRWPNVLRLAGGLFGVLALLAVGPDLVRAPEPEPLPPDVGLAVGIPAGEPVAPEPHAQRRQRERPAPEAEPERRRAERPQDGDRQPQHEEPGATSERRGEKARRESSETAEVVASVDPAPPAPAASLPPAAPPSGGTMPVPAEPDPPLDGAGEPPPPEPDSAAAAAQQFGFGH